jgi:hypothetical protein
MNEVQEVEVNSSEQRIAKLEEAHAKFSHWDNCRRGPEGPRGHQGEQGPQGPSADPTQVANIAAEIVKKSYKFESQISKVENLVAKFEQLLKNLAFEVTAVKASLQWAVIEELKRSRVIDAEGNAILIQGPKGDTGAESTIAGPSGKDGMDGKIGPAGRDAKIQIGSVVSGETASASLREEDGVQILDLVLPRGEKGETGATGASIVGPKGDKGDSIEGPQGVPGAAGLDRHAVAQVVLGMKVRGTI